MDNCPCFEDTIAFVMGSLLTQWHAVYYESDDRVYCKGVMPGSGWETWNDVAVWLWFESLKMIVGESM